MPKKILPDAKEVLSAEDFEKVKGLILVDQQVKKRIEELGNALNLQRDEVKEILEKAASFGKIEKTVVFNKFEITLNTRCKFAFSEDIFKEELRLERLKDRLEQKKKQAIKLGDVRETERLVYITVKENPNLTVLDDGSWLSVYGEKGKAVSS